MGTCEANRSSLQHLTSSPNPHGGTADAEQPGHTAGGAAGRAVERRDRGGSGEDGTAPQPEAETRTNNHHSAGNKGDIS